MWGWGQIVAGDRRGWLGPAAQVAVLAAFAIRGPGLVAGTNVELRLVDGSGTAGGPVWRIVGADIGGVRVGG
ncbi:MAG: hypothetical protein M3R57_01550 [Chloroflexota bacterium]|nr:hypothetical protein [Chloroflexota bacterium]